MDPPCPFSVEVTVSADESSETSVNSSMASNIVGIVRDGDEESPALVPVGTGGGSDTDDSFSQGDDDEEEDDVDTPTSARVAARSSSRSSHSKGSTSSKPMHMQTTTDTVGVIDCLSDQFSNMFLHILVVVVHCCCRRNPSS